jgi:hypothetical protein
MFSFYYALILASNAAPKQLTRNYDTKKYTYLP